MESLRIYNTLARDKQVFVPRQPGEVRMYVCGITVYDYCHVGHARMLVVFDLVQRWLRAIGYRVTYVRNITDIDDKIIRRAVENGETIKSLTDRFIDAMHEDEDALGIQRPDIEPRATQFIPQMLGMIERLEANGYAYQATDGDVNYSVRKFANYGKLSGKSLDDLRAGERVAANDAKEDPLDFVLWKRAKADDPEGASWESKYGMGRPGWHIECSAMGCTLLGEHFDIHGGGQDLQFPHHENEIAQSEGATGQTFVNYWLHNGFVQVDNEKMSKSLGNFFTIREVLERYDAEVMRFFIVRTHYRSPLNYSDVHLDDARASLTRLYTALKDVEPDALALDWSEPHAQRFAAAMNDDFNTPVAIATLFELAGEVNRTRDASLARQLKQLAGLLGLLGREPRAFLQQASGAAQAGALSADEIEAKIAARAAAKRAKDYAEADRIRAELLDAGVALEDKPGGSTEWRRV
ncbi:MULTISPECIES: cysteine--tRNA ligase [Burkholderia]|uniref:Cysteine--tRNA ligase n=1 Tax=Burkholderia multivorans TaxID=87883 RepID=A0A8E2RVF3_9BURK|nr:MULTISPECIES: cysteine--tRNA ligase [Burkholderia]AOJ92528.1 cysteine--tRNA ligase [Burkholderia multivorans]EKS9915557.1 cysteine--tRNA ligase [Burkholderia multivorans]KOE26864.1 cysteinyl-tRNA synthetase [Burkholderia multivorans R-20526]MBJ9685009.1 cysteine--tRNA ligase [Burkholderia multivorans]MBU9208902.1 cysteine--tRNA ligase [Burkholderia multivorans]